MEVRKKQLSLMDPETPMSPSCPVDVVITVFTFPIVSNKKDSNNRY